MPVSDVTSVTFQQEYFLGDPPPFFSSVEETQTETSVISIPGVSAFPGYPYTMDVPASPPNPDRILTTVTLQTESGTDSDGIVYGGNFRPITQDIGIVGLTDPLEQAAARTALTVTAGSLIGNTVTDQYSVNTFGLASLGISEFGYIIPYREQDIDIPGGTQSAPFIRMLGTATEVTYSISPDDPRAITIQIPSEQVTEDVLSIENVSIPGFRFFDFFFVQPFEDRLVFTYQENINGRIIFQIELNPDSVPSPMSIDNSSFDSTYPELGWGLAFNFATDVNGVRADQFRSRAYAYRALGATSTNDIQLPTFARVVFGRGCGLRTEYFPANDTIRFSPRTATNASSRIIPNIVTFSNNTSLPLTVQFDQGVNALIVTGNDAGGNLAGASASYNTVSFTFRTIGEVIDDINAQLQLIDGWENASFSIADESYNQFARASFMVDIGAVPVPEGQTQSWNMELPSIGIADPDYSYTVQFTGRTFRQHFDIKTAFEQATGNRLGLPIADFETNMPDSWLDWPDTARMVNEVSLSGVSGPRNILFQGLDRDSQPTVDRWHMNRYIGGSVYDWEWDSLIAGGFTTIQDFCDFINNYPPYQGMLRATPGTDYGSVSINAIRPEPSTGIWNRVGYSIYTVRPEDGSTDTNQIIIKGGQSNIGGSADFPDESIPGSQTYSFDNGKTIGQLAAEINVANTGLLFATVLNGAENVLADEILIGGAENINAPDATATLEAVFDQEIIEQYRIDDYGTIEALVGDMAFDWSSRGVNFQVITGTNDRPDAVPQNLDTINPAQVADLTSGDIIFTGQVSLVDPPDSVPEAFVYLDYKLNWVGDVNPGIDEQGIQVALGGYKDRDGELFINPAPNAFFEPGFNTLFDATFSVTEADEIYIIVRTRQNVEGDTFTSNPTDYQGLVRFSNGFPSQVAGASSFSGSPFDVWADSDWNGGNVPAVISVSAEANIMTLFADDTNIIDSIQVQINNFPAELDEFAFLALNRTNQNASMTESQNGRVFGLVLDNRGIWDVLIGPESEIQRVIDGEFDYLSFSFNHETIDSDEAYNFEFFNIDPNIANSVDLIPVPGFPRVAVLRISAGVKRYLSQLRAAAPPNSIDGCSVDIDILAEGRESSAQGIARVTVFADYRCVYDIGLCDFFWNLTDPPSPQPPDSVENTIEISYTDYIDCDKLDVDSEGDNARISFPLLITFQGVPVFENANSLLLIKGTYSESVEGYYFPPRSSFANIQNPACDDITDNEPLSDRLNQEILFLEGVDEPITNTLEISRIINVGTEPYLYIKPQFQFPGIDSEFECGPNEVVIAGIGYQTRDWEAGLRQDDILIGVNSVIANSSFSAPEIEFCYKFYYRRES
jgi:hypothetical protein